MSHIFDYGPTGRTINVDDEGRLIINAGEAAASYVFGYGDTGRYISVDGNGRLLVSAVGLSGVVIGSGITEQQLIDTSGVLRNDITELQAVSGNYYEKSSDLIPENGSQFDIGSPSKLFNTIHSHKTQATSGLFNILEVDAQATLSSGLDVTNNINCGDTVIAQSGRFTEGLQIGSGSFHLSPNGDLSIPGTKVNVADIGTGGSSGVTEQQLLDTSGVLRNDITELQAVSGEISKYTEQQLLDASGVLRNDITDLQAVSGGINRYTEVVSSWSASGELYYHDVTHGLGTEDILVRYLNNNTKESIGVDKDKIIDSNTLRIFVTSTAIPVKVIAL